MPMIAAAGIGAGASLISGLMGMGSADAAATAQLQGADNAINAQLLMANNAQNYQQWVYGTNRNDIAPWRNAGTFGIDSLVNMLKSGQFPDWTGKFMAPQLNETTDPGYRARLQLGVDALNNSAASKGNLLTGGTARALNQYGQDFASNEYGNVYGRAFNEYLQNYNQFQTNQANKFNRYGSLAGVGQQAVNTTAQLGQQAANNVGGIYMNAGNQIGNDYNLAGAARASGYVGGTNALMQGINGATNSLSTYALLNSMYGNGGTPPYMADYNPDIFHPGP